MADFAQKWHKWLKRHQWHKCLKRHPSNGTHPMAPLDHQWHPSNGTLDHQWHPPPWTTNGTLDHQWHKWHPGPPMAQMAPWTLRWHPQMAPWTLRWHPGTLHHAWYGGPGALSRWSTARWVLGCRVPADPCRTARSRRGPRTRKRAHQARMLFVVNGHVHHPGRVRNGIKNHHFLAFSTPPLGLKTWPNPRFR